MFCSAFDEQLAEKGPPAVFLFDRDGLLRLADNWTRDVTGRAEGVHAHSWCWLLLRDQGTGFVQLALVTSPTLIVEHPRLDIRSYSSLEEARAARDTFGSPPLCEEPW